MKEPGLRMVISLLLAFGLIPGLSWAMCPEKCTCDDVNLIVTCIKAGLEVMPNTLNPRLETIVYKYNNFPTVDVSLRFLSKLVNVDLSHNHIISISDRAFARNSDMKQLKLDGNKISQVSNKTFYGLSNVEVISLRGNEINHLPENLFKFAPQVQKVDLARNSINSVHAQAFDGLQHSLKILHLENNFLSSVPIEALSSLLSLSELHLSGNPLKVIPSNAFVHFHRLTSLDLTSCRLEEVHNLAFNGLGTLRTLKISDNNLPQIPTEALRRVPNLHNIHLGRNPLEIIAKQSLFPLNQLKHLDITGCSKLAKIEGQAFQGASDLKHVTISLNRALKSIDPSAFDAALTSLHKLDLSDNALKQIPANLVPWTRLKSLDLSGNPWHCDCDLNFLPKVLHKLVEKANVSDKIVAGKCSNNGQSLFDAQMECQESSLSSNSLDVIEDNSIKTVLSTKDEALARHEASNATAVIVSVSIVSTVVILTIFMFIYLKWCKRHVQDWIKEYKWRRHDARLAQKTVTAMDQQYPYLKGDNYIYTSPRLHHTYVYHGQSPLHSAAAVQQYYTQTTTSGNTDNDDEYFYVSNHYNASGGPQDTAVVMNNGYATTAKHIPVTVL